MGIINALDNKTVEIFLKQIDKELKKGHLRIISRKVDIGDKIVNHKQALLDLKIYSVEELKEKLYNLKIEDCFRVSFDYDITRDYNSEIFEFRKKVNGIQAYIKLFIDRNGVVCFSFHRSKEG